MRRHGARTMRPLHASLLALAGACAAAQAAAAQQRDTTRADTSRVERPFVRGGVYDKPFENRLGSRTAFGGYAEAHARMERADGVAEESGFVAK